MAYRSDGKTVPRLRWEPLLYNSWADDRLGTDWEAPLRTVASELGVVIRFDRAQPVRKSAYWPAFQPAKSFQELFGPGSEKVKPMPAVLVGAKGTEAQICGAALHELGHRTLEIQEQAPKDPVENEKRAWKIAFELAQRHRLPLDPSVVGQGLWSYKRGAELRRQKGSKARNKRPKPRTLTRLIVSAAAAEAGRMAKNECFGAKGRRLEKKWLRERTHRVLRRRLRQNLKSGDSEAF